MSAESTVSCPYCGEEIAADAKACPHCGSDERTGWSSQTYMDGIDVDFEEDYEEIKEKEFSSRTKKTPLTRMVIGGILLLMVLLYLLRSFL